MRKFYTYILICISFNCFSQKAVKDNISIDIKINRIEVFALNPSTLVMDFTCRENRLREILSKPSEYEAGSFISDRYVGVVLGQDERVVLITKLLKKLKKHKPLRCKDYNLYCRVLLDIYYEDGHKEVLYIDDAIRQCIYYNGVKYNRYFILYKAILKLLPESFGKNVKKNRFPTCW